MASINKHGNKWQVRIYRKNSPTICTSFMLLKDAQAWARNVELRLERGEAPDKEIVELSMLIDRYLSSVSPTKKGYKQEAPRLRASLSHPLAKRAAADDRLKLIHFGQSISSKIDPPDRRLIHAGSVIVAKKAGQISMKRVGQFLAIFNGPGPLPWRRSVLFPAWWLLYCCW